jgi:putative membrane protein insertion efficiency factor
LRYKREIDAVKYKSFGKSYLDINAALLNGICKIDRRGDMKYFTGLVLLCLLQTAVRADSFKPWDADVAVGDETIGGMTVGGGGHTGHAAAGSQTAYDSFTGGSVILIRMFQIWISPQDGPNCRFRPTCSAYGKGVVQKYGAFLGSVLIGDRILRCNPFSEPGNDPVPDFIFNR